MALPTEHGGWGLTLEPVLLGLLLRPSWVGLALGIAAFLAFVARTPLKVVSAMRLGVAQVVAGLVLVGLTAVGVWTG